MTEEQRRTTELLAVTVDPPEDIQKMIDRIAAEDGIIPEFPMLSDPDHRVIDRYGIFNPSERRGRPVPHPTTLVIDMDGIVRWRVTEINYRMRPELEDILGALAEVERS